MLESLGTYVFLISHEQEELKAAAGTLDGIIDTVSAAYPAQLLMSLLKPDQKLIVVGAPDKPFEVHSFALIIVRKTMAWSDFWGKGKIHSQFLWLL